MADYTYTLRFDYRQDQGLGRQFVIVPSLGFRGPVTFKLWGAGGGAGAVSLTPITGSVYGETYPTSNPYTLPAENPSASGFFVRNADASTLNPYTSNAGYPQLSYMIIRQGVVIYTNHVSVRPPSSIQYYPGQFRGSALSTDGRGGYWHAFDLEPNFQGGANAGGGGGGGQVSGRIQTTPGSVISVWVGGGGGRNNGGASNSGSGGRSAGYYSTSKAVTDPNNYTFNNNSGIPILKYIVGFNPETTAEQDWLNILLSIDPDTGKARGSLTGQWTPLKPLLLGDMTVMSKMAVNLTVTADERRRGTALLAYLATQGTATGIATAGFVNPPTGEISYYAGIYESCNGGRGGRLPGAPGGGGGGGATVLQHIPAGNGTVGAGIPVTAIAGGGAGGGGFYSGPLAKSPTGNTAYVSTSIYTGNKPEIVKGEVAQTARGVGWSGQDSNYAGAIGGGGGGAGGGFIGGYGGKASTSSAAYSSPGQAGANFNQGSVGFNAGFYATDFLPPNIDDSSYPGGMVGQGSLNVNTPGGNGHAVLIFSRMPGFSIKKDGVWKSAVPHVKVPTGTFNQLKTDVWIKHNGVWKRTGSSATLSINVDSTSWNTASGITSPSLYIPPPPPPPADTGTYDPGGTAYGII